MIGAFIEWSPGRKDSPGYLIAENGCHLWVGAKREGYGAVDVETRLSLVHRVRYEKEVAPIPAGLVIDHKCRNRACCNPAHLEVVTIRENILRGDGLAARNARKTRCPQGHEYDFVNNRGNRCCLTCAHAQAKAYRRKRGIKT